MLYFSRFHSDFDIYSFDIIEGGEKLQAKRPVDRPHSAAREQNTSECIMARASGKAMHKLSRFTSISRDCLHFPRARLDVHV